MRSHHNSVVSKGSLEAMLGNPFYTGIIRIKRTGKVYQGAHDPLISPSLFEKVQEVRAGKSGKKVTKHSHMYHGLFECKLCGTAMIAERQKGHVYYRCHTPICKTKTVREEALEETIATVLARAQMTNENILTLTSKITEWLDKRVEAAPSNTYSMQLEQIGLRLERLTDALIDRLIDNESFNARKTTLVLEQAKLQEAIKAEQKKRPEAGHIQNFLELVKSLCFTYKIATKAEKRQIVRIATSNRSVSGRYVSVEPSNWLLTVQKAVGVLYCADDRTTSRSSPYMLELHLQSLIDAFHSAEATALLADFEQRSFARTNKNNSWHDTKQEPLDYRNRI